MTYKQYLKSNEWQKIRAKVFQRAIKNAGSNNQFGVCEKCGYEPYKNCLQVHHLSYGNNMNQLGNLILLCPYCHADAHGKTIKGKTNKPP